MNYDLHDNARERRDEHSGEKLAKPLEERAQTRVSLVATQRR